MTRRKKIFTSLMIIVVALIAGAVIYGFMHQGKIMRLLAGWKGDNAPIAYAEGERLQNIPVFIPKGDPRGFVIFVTDKGDSSANEQALQKSLLEHNLIVANVRFDAWRKALDAEDGECIYLVSDLEALAKDVARRLDLEQYFRPVIVGLGEGGAITYAAASDSPLNTLAGAVSIDASSGSHTRLPSCTENALATKTTDNGFQYGLNVSIPVPTVIIDNKNPIDNNPIEIGESGDVAVLAHVSNDAQRIKQAADTALAFAIRDNSDNALPVVDLPSKQAPKAVVIFFSGDGGWRDIDMQIGDWMQNHDVHVVGVDSLRYFWAKKTPEEMAHDIEQMIKKADPTGKLPVSLFGYSFGADALPFAWPLLDSKTANRIKMIALMGVSMSADFQVSIDGWFGGAGDMPVLPALQKMPMDKTICIYGDEEDDTACASKDLGTMQRIELKGGHHFDEDYASLAQTLHENLLKRINN
ncbi:virulence factor family protein [Bartonella sp. HY406]|uniref:virulence factor family protein n=1 Tax=Bartonella sp. HY406 TaxID=2979331 RepID=UPI0021C96F7F|nr:AcvB/VirJ family lysyl-phosphatidylglycerol hydrolase [Bartonella sp. HY406]UXN02927.1 virulence factor family protein [Bartonella sp. HY406]